jgi:lysyl endopeptidase
VTLHPGAGAPAAGRPVAVDRVARGFTTPEEGAHLRDDRRRESAAATELARGEGREESVCGSDDKQDAACYKSTNPVAYNRSKAVARLLINGVELCSAWRVGPNNRMFTNHHCLADGASARKTEVWFDYECAVCGGHDTLTSTKVWADTVLATDARLDYTLFSVQKFSSIARFGYLRLDPRGARAGEELYIPQHPGGDPTKIAIDGPAERDGNCRVDNPRYQGYGNGTDLSYYCDTAGGSSGSPVLSRDTNQVVGLHHLGGCPNSGVRMDLIAAQVARLL